MNRFSGFTQVTEAEWIEHVNLDSDEFQVKATGSPHYRERGDYIHEYTLNDPESVIVAQTFVNIDDKKLWWLRTSFILTFNVISIRKDNLVRTRMNRQPMSLSRAKTFASKITVHSFNSIIVEEAQT